MAQIETRERLVELIPEPSPVASAKLLDRLDEQAQTFIARSPFLLVATVGEAGLEISPKGDDPGFVEIVSPTCLLIPERSGNQLKMGLRNILANGRIGLMFLCPPTGDALRVAGRATLHDDRKICASGKPRQARNSCDPGGDRAGVFSLPAGDPARRIVETRNLGRAHADFDGQGHRKGVG